MSLKIVVFGLSLSSSWGNGHATTYRALLKGLAGLGHEITFFERDMPWYAQNRDLPEPSFAALVLYDRLEEIWMRAAAVAAADVVILGSFVPEGIELGRRLARRRRGAFAFYDIDTPVTLARLEAGACDYLSRDLVPAFDLYLSFTGGPILERLEREFKAQRALPLYCAVDPESYRPLDLEASWRLGYLGTYGEDRQQTLETLLLAPARALPDVRFAVAGPQYPDHVLWPANVDRIEHLPPEQHRGFYCRQDFTLNVTRAAMVAAGFAPSVRLFEAAACGTPILSDWWAGLDEIFVPGREIFIARDTAEAMAVLMDLPDAARREVGRAARRRVLAAHTGTARAEELLARLGLAAPA